MLRGIDALLFEQISLFMNVGKFMRSNSKQCEMKNEHGNEWRKENNGKRKRGRERERMESCEQNRHTHSVNLFSSILAAFRLLEVFLCSKFISIRYPFTLQHFLSLDIFFCRTI